MPQPCMPWVGTYLSLEKSGQLVPAMPLIEPTARTSKLWALSYHPRLLARFRPENERLLGPELYEFVWQKSNIRNSCSSIVTER